MKKCFLLAILLYLSACYAPLNNSGMATNKSWLEIPAKRTDFQGKAYDSCYQFKLRFIPQEADAELDLRETCLDSCCWMSEKTEVVLDFNKNFEKNLKFYGRANKYTPAKITLKMTHSNFLNTSAVHISPRGAISMNGTVKLKQETVEDPVRLAQIEEQARRLQAQHNARLADEEIERNTVPEVLAQDPKGKEDAQELVQKTVGTQIDQYFYRINKEYQQKGYVFLISKRFYTAQLTVDGTYRVTCHAQTRTGTQADELKARTVSCGVWTADLHKNTVKPQDSLARQIKAAN